MELFKKLSINHEKRMNYFEKKKKKKHYPGRYDKARQMRDLNIRKPVTIAFQANQFFTYRKEWLHVGQRSLCSAEQLLKAQIRSPSADRIRAFISRIFLGMYNQCTTGIRCCNRLSLGKTE